MHAHFILRQANIEDCEGLTQLDQLCNPSPWTHTHFQAAVLTENDEVWLIEHEHHIIALIVWQRIYDEMELHLIDTHPDYRRLGLATQLMSKMVNTAQRHNVQRIFLEVREHNLAAQALYHRYDFIRIALRQHYYQSGENAIMMEKLC